MPIGALRRSLAIARQFHGHVHYAKHPMRYYAIAKWMLQRVEGPCGYQLAMQ